MSLTRNRLSSNVLPALLSTLLFLIPSGEANAQYNPRVFQTAFFEEPAAFPTFPTRADVDIRSFEGSVQPPGFSIYQSLGYKSTLPPACVYPPPIPPVPCLDWSRIVAVEIDEPYNSLDGYLDNDNCTPPPASAFTPIDTDLSNLAAKLKSLNPKARFWVNLDTNEADWVDKCIGLGVVVVQAFNRPYFDVISVDWYNQYWSPNTTIEQFYKALAEYPETPHQQVALVPGVYSAPNDQSVYWSGYFEYANSTNQTHGCSLPLGSQGVTGIFDGCPVWIVMGWLTGDFTDKSTNTKYNGILDGSQGSQLDLAEWQSVVAQPPSPVLLRARGAIANYFRPSINLLLQ